MLEHKHNAGCALQNGYLADQNSSLMVDSCCISQPKPAQAARGGREIQIPIGPDVVPSNRSTEEAREKQ
jgi:hypothetical protein